MKKITEH